ncbi:MAG: 50S ribosomal protein L32 [Dehalococcoidia bacterium]
MAVPKRKTSKQRSRTRRSHRAYSIATLSVCPQCHNPKPPHQVCTVCGSYRGREVYETKSAKR